ncbi:glycosyltransferase family 52 [Kluyvera ascorbata]|uniref:glycosyltransferase family 52 n=1 Tax=Kluyvera ascorbata TaxID=51288 RepID=UPI00374D782A
MHEKLKDAAIIILAYQLNDKYKYYISYMRKLSTEVTVIDVSRSGKWGNVFNYAEVTRLCYQIKNRHFHKVFLASIDNKFVHLILSKANFSIINTFDDGTANIIRTSSYYLMKKESIKSYLSRVILGISFTKESVISLTKQHYTIYPNTDNIIKNTVAISIVNSAQIESASPEKIIRVFLGQPFEELDISFSTIERFIIKNKIDHYYPHPRECNIYHSLNYIHSPQIVEEYIISSLEKSSVQFEVYAVMSTSILNIAAWRNPNIKLYTLFNADLKGRHSGYYEMAEKQMVNLVEIIN